MRPAAWSPRWETAARFAQTYSRYLSPRQTNAVVSASYGFGLQRNFRERQQPESCRRKCPIGQILTTCKPSQIGFLADRGIRRSRTTNLTAPEPINKSMNKPTIKSLGAALDRIEELEMDLAEAGIKFPSKPALKTLGIANTHIAKLEKLRSVRTPSPVEPSGSSANALKKPAAKAFTIPTDAVAKADLGSLTSLKAVQARLDAAVGAEARVNVLNEAVNALRAQAKTLKNCSLEQLQILKSAAQCEKRMAYEMLDAGTLKKAFRGQPQDLA